MIFDDVKAKEPVINEYFWRCRHNKCDMVHLNQNIFSLDRQITRESCNICILFEQSGNVLQSEHSDFFNENEIGYKDFAKMCNKVWREPYNYIVIDRYKIYIPMVS